jgi:hypothetical protein
MTGRFEADPDWQRALGALLREDYPSASAGLTARVAAAYGMQAIEHAYETDPGLVPRASFELTPVHDPVACRRRRVAKITSDARVLYDRLLTARAERDSGLMDGRTYELGAARIMALLARLRSKRPKLSAADQRRVDQMRAAA